MPQLIIGYGPANGDNFLGLDPEDGNLVNVFLTIQRAEEADDTRNGSAAKSRFSRAAAASKAIENYNPYLYLNYAAYFQNPIAG